MFRGRIAFVFDCLDSLCALDDPVATERLQSLYDDVFIKFFDEGKFDEELFNRSMLTLSVGSNFSYYDYWSSSWYAINAEKRKFVINLVELNYYIYCERGESKDYIKQLCLLLLSKDYQQIIDGFVMPDGMPSWKEQLIRNPSWIKNRKSDFFAITNDGSDCYLLKSQRPLTPDGGQLVSET